ncbi:MAG: DNA polymerase domain-containing protein [Nitrosopumilaceae archaeon]
MSYISTITKREERDEHVWVWERDGKRILKKYRIPYYFYTKDPAGKYMSIFGDTLKKHEFLSGYDFYATRKRLQGEGQHLFESDISFESKILSAHYYNKPAPKLHVTFLDIEVDFNKNLGFPSPENPYGEIISVALYHQWQNCIMVYTIPPDGVIPDTNDFVKQMENKECLPKDVEFDIVFCKTEVDLLKYFLEEIQDADILSGWNSGGFDIPYIAKRLVKHSKHFGEDAESLLCFKNAGPPEWDEVSGLGGRVFLKLGLKGRQEIDYLLLYKKYTVVENRSYKLESIAEIELPNLPKLEYPGTLSELYRNDYPFFVRYNIRDVEILKGFEEKLGFMSLANEIAHLTTSGFKAVTGVLKLTEAAIINYCHYDLKRIVPDKKEMGQFFSESDSERGGEVEFEAHAAEQSKKKGRIQGAYVLEPKVGMHEWLGSIDINSLYPSAIRAINISPETIIGQFEEKEFAAKCIVDSDTDGTLILHYDDGREDEYDTGKEWRDILTARKWAVSGYGTVYNQNKVGIIPSILKKWIVTRKQYQKQAKEAENADTAKYYDRLQIVYKYMLNSAYGALSNLHFKFFDLRAGESVTGTGRLILKHQCAEVNKLLVGEYDIYGDAIIAGDTDSTYFLTFAQNKDEAIETADAVAEGVNGSFQTFMKHTFLCCPEYDSVIRVGREIVADRGIFVEKKRYVLHVIDKEGSPPKPGDELKVMGLDIKKTTLPKEIAKKLFGFIKRLMEGEDWNILAKDIIALKEEIGSTPDFMLIGLPKGLSASIDAYTKKYEIDGVRANLPGHIAASIMWNNQLKVHNDQISTQVVRGTKVKVFYLTKVFDGKFKSIAVPVDIEQPPQWFVDEFYPIIDREAQIERLVDNPLNNIFRAINRETPSKQSLLIDDLLGF